jgi:hypothetical protein
MDQADFAARFCEHFNCPRAEIDEQLFRRALYVHARFLAPFLRKFNTNFFQPDFQMIHLRTGRRKRLRYSMPVLSPRR